MCTYPCPQLSYDNILLPGCSVYMCIFSRTEYTYFDLGGPGICAYRSCSSRNLLIKYMVRTKRHKADRTRDVELMYAAELASIL